MLFDVLLLVVVCICCLVDDFSVIVEDFIKVFDGIGNGLCCGCYFDKGIGVKVVLLLCVVVDDFDV